jgi:hypothetical protein
MWQGCEDALRLYMNACIAECIRRGFINNMLPAAVETPLKMPEWLVNKVFHASHRSNLLRKDGRFYRRYLWKEPPDLPYFWPRQPSRS